MNHLDEKPYKWHQKSAKVRYSSIEEDRLALIGFEPAIPHVGN
jgi:hypothetical protein